MNKNFPSKRRKLPAALVTTAVAAALSVPLVSASDSDVSREYDSGNKSSVTVPMQFRNGATHLRVLSDVNGTAMAEGDIIFGDSTKYFNPTKLRSSRGLSNEIYGTVWPNGLVPYQISDQLSSSAKSKVRGAIESWNKTGSIRLVERTSATASAFPNYIDFVDASQCASWVGFQNQGAQSIYTGDKCSEGSMIHEIGHALGLLHEHTRPDRDSFVRINWDNITAEKSHNFDILDDSILLGDYDYESIMHYGSHFFSKSGNATITAIQNTNVEIGQREFISEGDANSVAELYRSEFSLVSSGSGSTDAGDDIQLDLFVTNNSDMGANSMQVATTVPDNVELTSFSSASWTCQQAGAGADVICLTPILADGASSSVSVNLSVTETSGDITLSSELTASTYDVDPSNNRDQVTLNAQGATNDTLIASNNAPEPSIGAAEVTPSTAAPQIAAPVAAAATKAPVSSAESDGGAGGSSGGGAFSALGLILMLMRRKLR